MVRVFINAYHISERIYKQAFYKGCKRCYIYNMKQKR